MRVGKETIDDRSDAVYVPPAQESPEVDDGRRVVASSLVETLQRGIESSIRGKTEVVRCFLASVLAGGSVLLEDMPGTGKTTLAKSFARLVDLRFNRVQCTPDLLPSDVCGFSVYRAEDGSFEVRKGPVFCNVLLVDEINRASPRTQSALLESMAEKQVTIEGEHYSLPAPFLVIATQNPIGFQGTYPLPEAQLDRFLLHLSLDYPDHESEMELLYLQGETKEPSLESQINSEDFLEMQRRVTEVNVAKPLADYIVKIIHATRNQSEIALGASPRGSQMLFRAAQAEAFLGGRGFVLPDDIQYMAPFVLAHRIVLNRTANLSNRHQDKRQLISDIVRKIAVPA
ncbi:MAG: AAA family ATPase [Aureliella sp.]